MTAGATADPRPLPLPDDISRFYWDGARDGRLLLQRCLRCSKYQYPPDVACVHCQSVEIEPSEVSGRGQIWSYVVVGRVFHEGFSAAVPYVVGLIELEEQDGLRLLTNVVDVSPDAVRVGMAVEVTFEDHGEIVLPQFRPAALQ